jgi:hypothetical protein
MDAGGRRPFSSANSEYELWTTRPATWTFDLESDHASAKTWYGLPLDRLR